MLFKGNYKIESPSYLGTNVQQSVPQYEEEWEYLSEENMDGIKGLKYKIRTTQSQILFLLFHMWRKYIRHENEIYNRKVEEK